MFSFQISNNCLNTDGAGDIWSIFATGWIECDRNGMCADFTWRCTVISIRSHIKLISSRRIVSKSIVWTLIFFVIAVLSATFFFHIDWLDIDKKKKQNEYWKKKKLWLVMRWYEKHIYEICASCLVENENKSKAKQRLVMECICHRQYPRAVFNRHRNMKRKNNVVST